MMLCVDLSSLIYYYSECHCAAYHVVFIVMLNVIMLSAIVLNVIMQSAAMLSVVAPFRQMFDY